MSDQKIPSAAETVNEGTLNERELELQRKLDAAESRAKKAETDAAYIADERDKLKKIQSVRPSAEVPVSKTSGWGFFREPKN